MVDRIYEIKNKIIEQVEQQMRERPDRVDGEMIDAIKDLAAAEKDCWEADYYRAVTEAMEGEGGSGYSSGGSSHGGSSGGSSGWQNQYGSGRNSGGRRGYGSMGYQEAMDTMRHYMRNSDPVERERVRGEMMSM